MPIQDIATAFLAAVFGNQGVHLILRRVGVCVGQGLTIDLFAGRIIGGRVSSSARARTDFVFEARSRRCMSLPQQRQGLTHHSDCGVRQVSIRSGQRLAEGRGHKKPRNHTVGRGGYGWTRTTDPSIMSAVL